jgi:arylsulfatase A-like enzyme
MKEQKPHIIYVLTDEHRGQAMSHMGDPNLKTPVMDRLAQEGVSFTNAYANCPICTPSRGTIFSGRHAHAGPVQAFFDNYKAASPSTATILRDAGYRTAYFGKWHCGIVRNQMSMKARLTKERGGIVAHRTPKIHRAGFEDWYAYEIFNDHYDLHYYKTDDPDPIKAPGYEPDAFTDLVIDYLENYDSDKPLFLVLSILAPHFELDPPEEWQRFNPGSLTVRPNFTDTPEMRVRLAKYYAMVENIDWNLGKLVSVIDSNPKFENTLLCYTSDHGEYMGCHGRFNRKEEPHEESVRIPAIFRWKGRIAPTGKVSGLFSLVDMMPTTLGLVGIDVPQHSQGTDFSPLIRGEKFSGPEEVLLEMTINPRWNLDFLDWRGFVTREWKYAFYETGEELLFNLGEDPFELNNLAETHHDKRDEMRKRLLDLLDKTREPYFDVLINHGVQVEREDIDVSKL